MQFAAAGTASLDADEAVTGVMARRILNGDQFYTYFTRQSYNGSFEQYVQALMYAVTRLPETPFTLRLTQVFLALATMISTYFLGRLIFTSHWTAVLATAIYAAGPLWNVVLGTKSYGAYDTTQLACVVAAIATLRVTGFGAPHLDSVGRGRLTAWWTLLGFCIGIVAWSGLSGMEVLLALIVWAMPTFARSLRAVFATVIGGLLGMSPVLFWMSRHGWDLPGLGGEQPHTTVLRRLDILYRQVGREYLGMSLAGNSSPWPPYWEHVVFLGLALAVVTAIWLRWQGLASALTFRAEHRAPIDLVLLTIPCAVIVYLAVSHTWFAGNPRYLFVLYPMTSVATAAAIAWLARRPFPGIRIVVVLATVVGLTTTSLTVVHSTHVLNAPNAKTTEENFRQADAYLVSEGIHAVYAPYWDAIPADYWADPNKLTVANWTGNGGKSWKARVTVDKSPDFAYMTGTRGGTAPDASLVKALTNRGVTYQTHKIGTVTIYTDLSKKLRPEQLGF